MEAILLRQAQRGCTSGKHKSNASRRLQIGELGWVARSEIDDNAPYGD
jgi:hypothetical protein